MKTVSIDWDVNAQPISDQLTKHGVKYAVDVIDELEENVSAVHTLELQGFLTEKGADKILKRMNSRLSIYLKMQNKADE